MLEGRAYERRQRVLKNVRAEALQRRRSVITKATPVKVNNILVLLLVIGSNPVHTGSEPLDSNPSGCGCLVRTRVLFLRSHQPEQTASTQLSLIDPLRDFLGHKMPSVALIDTFDHIQDPKIDYYKFPHPDVMSSECFCRLISSHNKSNSRFKKGEQLILRICEAGTNKRLVFLPQKPLKLLS